MKLLQRLQDIVDYIQISSSDLLVSLPNYQIQKKIGDDLIAHLKKLSHEIQDEYFSSLLSNFIFGIYCNDLLRETRVIKIDSEIELKNTASEVDWQFYEQIHRENYGKGWWNPNFRVLRQEADGSLAVEKKSIVVHIQPEHHLRLEERSAGIGDLVSVYTLHYQVVNQFYVASGNLVSSFNHPILCIYFNFSPEGAVALMRHLTTELNTMNIPFTFNVLHNPLNYERYDSGFMRINKDSYELIWPVLQAAYTENKSQFNSQVPMFTKLIAPGLGLAERPEYEYRFMDDFGMNRCQIVADALLEAHKNGDESPESRMKYILKHFENLEIDIERPYLNPNSEDIYTPLY